MIILFECGYEILNFVWQRRWQRQENKIRANCFILDLDESGAELDTDRQIVIRSEALIGELQQQTRFADGCITDNDVP